MLHEFIEAHRDGIVERARSRVAARRDVAASEGELVQGVPLFLSQIAGLLRGEQPPGPGELTDERVGATLGTGADLHGGSMLRAGLTVAQLVEGYGDVCQAITDEADAAGASIAAAEYRSLNLCLDVATARAVAAFSTTRDEQVARAGTERLGALAHELRNLLSTAMLAYEALRRGAVGVEGRTGAVLGRSLRGLQDVIDRSLTEVRLSAGLIHPERIELAAFLEEIEAGALLDAHARGLMLAVAAVDPAVEVRADRQLLASAVANLVHNALKFTRPSGHVSVTAHQDHGRVSIDVEDECGGLAPGKEEELFRPFHGERSSRSGLGLGLKISLDAVRANGGQLHVRNLPGKGCVFSVEVAAGG